MIDKLKGYIKKILALITKGGKSKSSMIYILAIVASVIALLFMVVQIKEAKNHAATIKADLAVALAENETMRVRLKEKDTEISKLMNEIRIQSALEIEHILFGETGEKKEETRIKGSNIFQMLAQEERDLKAASDVAPPASQPRKDCRVPLALKLKYALGAAALTALAVMLL